jgi:hypothetical protein
MNDGVCALCKHPLDDHKDFTNIQKSVEYRGTDYDSYDVSECLKCRDLDGPCFQVDFTRQDHREWHAAAWGYSLDDEDWIPLDPIPGN